MISLLCLDLFLYQMVAFLSIEDIRNIFGPLHAGSFEKALKKDPDDLRTFTPPVFSNDVPTCTLHGLVMASQAAGTKYDVTVSYQLLSRC